MNLFEGKFAPIIVTVTVAMMAMPALAAKPTLLKDIAPGTHDLRIVGTTQTHLYASSSAPYAVDSAGQVSSKLLPKEILGEIVELGATALFGYNDNIHGNELWRSDGTRAGTYLLKDLLVGPESGGPRTFVHWGGKVYFTTTAKINEVDPAKSILPQLWSTDGTAEGTRLITPIDTLTWFDGEDGRSAALGRIVQLVAGQDRLFFNVDTIIHLFEFQQITLWQSDGTAPGTAKMVYPENNQPVFATNLLQSVGDITFFADDQPYWSDYAFDWEIGKLWRMGGDGQGIGAITEALASPTIGVFQGRVYFLTRDDSGVYLSRTGENATTVETVELLYPASSSRAVKVKFMPGSTSLFIGINDRYYGGDIKAVWAFSPSEQTTEKLTDLVDNVELESILVKDDMLYFSNGPADNIELWRSDGTSAGTGLYRDLNPTGSSYPSMHRLFAGELWFSAYDGSPGIFFRTNGADEVVKVNVEVSDGVGSQPRQFTALKNGMTLFRERSSYFITRGTPESTLTHALSQHACSYCDIEPLLPIGQGALLLNTRDAALWLTDGRSGTEGVQAIMGGMWGTSGRYPVSKQMLAPLGQNDALFFSVVSNPDWTRSRKLWRTGTLAGTALVKTLPLPTPSLGNSYYPKGIEAVVAHQNFAFFMGNDDPHGNELWRTDGSESGTYMVKDLVPGNVEVTIENITSARHHVYFSYSAGNRNHLAKSRGSDKDTKRIATLPEHINAIQDVTSVNDSIFFRSGRDLYRSNGQPGNLRRLGQFSYSSVDESSPYFGYDAVTTDWPAEMTAFGDHLYFIARKNATSPLQIWRADLKKTRAEVVTPKFKVNAFGAKDVDFYVHGNRLFLAVLDRTGQGGGIFELRTSGKNLQWIRHTDMPARELRIAGGKLYFAGLDNQYGEEPRVMTLPKKP